MSDFRGLCHVIERMMKRLLLFSLNMFIMMTLFGQFTKTVTGIIIDSETQKKLPFVNVYWKSDITSGTISNNNGGFTLVQLTDNNTNILCDTLIVKHIGYETKAVAIERGQENIIVKLKKSVVDMAEVTVTASYKREKYNKKENPAVQLMEKVIANKNKHRVQNHLAYEIDCYEKLTLYLDKIDFDFDSNWFWKDFSFLKYYVDTSRFNSSPMLNVSLRETLSKHYVRDNKEHISVLARNMQGVDKILNAEGVSETFEQLFWNVDVFEDDVDLLLNKFVSPLSSTRGISYYRYYIIDTVQMGGNFCVDVSFVPNNMESWGFFGHLFIALDEDYVIKKCILNVPKQMNVNFVSDVSIEQDFDKLNDSLWGPKETNNYANFYVIKNLRHLYYHQTRLYGEYHLHPPVIDSVFSNCDDLTQLSDAKHHTKEFWTENRPIPLQYQESLLDSLMLELCRVPKFNTTIKAAEILASGYVSTAREQQDSRIDFGPIYSFVSYNALEGVRFRIGGLTTANFNDHFFAYGYLAFGLHDKRLKYNATAIYSLVPKKYHPYESFRHALYFSSEYEVEIPGRKYSTLERDNILLSIPSGTPNMMMQYVRRNKFLYEKEWSNHLSIQTWVQNEVNEAAGELQYHRINSDESSSNVYKYNISEVGITLRYAPSKLMFNKNRIGKESLVNLVNDNPVLTLTHKVGYLDDFGVYNKSGLSIEKRFWLSSFGHIDVLLNSGLIWNRVPFPLLHIPNTNQSFILQSKSFNLMQPLEFICDSYVSLFATYYLKGWILNRIPLIKQLKLREVVSFSGLYGTLSEKNNPVLMSEGLFLLPDGTFYLDKVPYMEMSVGVENLFHFVRLDWVRRLNYLDHEDTSKNGIRLSFRVAF